jgi:hypothetical protein
MEMSASGQKADPWALISEVCFTLESRHVVRRKQCPPSANPPWVKSERPQASAAIQLRATYVSSEIPSVAT